ncbi:hypothetical protein BDW72DRAFT_181641 [Aspergillus terricola var. indicus]
MGHWLPSEVLLHIAEYLKEDRDSLVQCTRVCMRWKAVFERVLYRKLDVRSNDLKTSLGDLSLARFQALTSAAGIMRRSYIKRLVYHIVLPYDVRDWPDDTPNGETGTFRKANDAVFAVAIIDLFTALSFWENTRFTLAFEVVGCLDSYELGMEETSVDWQEEEQTPPPYQARLPPTEWFMLPEIRGINKFLVSDDLFRSVGMWNGTAFEIAHCYPMLESLELNLVAHEDSEFQRDRRKALVQGIKKLPPTLKKFRYSELYDAFMEKEIKAVDLLLGENDMLTPTMREFSLQLRELKLIGVAIAPDFLWPLDQMGEPASSTAEVSWPHLKTIELGPAQYLPTGEPLFEISPDLRITIKHEILHRFCIAMGYAARHMPCLTSIMYIALFEDEYFTRFNFSHYVSKGTGIRKGFLKFVSTYQRDASSTQYRPDERVKNAWGWQEGTEIFEFTTLNRELICKFPGWPPASW